MGSDGRVRSVDAGGFEQAVLQGGGRVAVEFMSYGCGYCRTIEPVLQIVADRIAAEETVLRVNIAAEPALARSYSVTGTPTFVMFLDGAEVGRAEGPDPTELAVTEAITRPFLL